MSVKSVKKCQLFWIRYWLLLFWSFIVIVIFYITYNCYKTKPEYFYLRKMLGIGLCIARGSASVLNISCFLVLMPMCRSIGTLLHSVMGRISSRILAVWLSNAKVFHMSFAVSIVLASILHSIAHIMNAFNFTKNYNEEYPDINWPSSKHQNPLKLLFTTIPGVTGFVMLFILLLLSFTSMRWFRDKYHNVFNLTHNVAILFMVLLILHPNSGVLKMQVNIIEHIPGCISNTTRLNTLILDIPNTYNFCEYPPQFTNIKSETWFWILIPLCIYLTEILYRFYSRDDETVIVKAYHLHGKVVHITLKLNKNLKIFPGQYILIKCPDISALEWHPFTIVSYTQSSQTCDYVTITVLIKAIGDWTTRLYKLIDIPTIDIPMVSYKYNNLHIRSLRFQTDGPYWSPMSKIVSSKWAVCIAAGIGITAFTASLKYLLENDSTTPKRIHLIWIIRHPTHVFWFSDLICDLINKYWNLNQPDRFIIQIHITRKDDDFNSSNNIFGEQYSILLHRTRYGRPNWYKEFQFLQQLYEKQTVHLFTCGPKKLSRTVRNHCLLNKKNKCNFVFIHDNYS